MKKFTMFLSAIALACLLVASPVMAGSPYVSLKGSVGTTDTGDIKLSHIPEGLVNATDTGSNDNVTSPGIAIGYDTGDVRFEFEYFNRSKIDHNTSLALLNGGLTLNGTYVPFPNLTPINDVIADVFNINSQVKTETFFLNMYADFPVAKKLELYAGAGVGMAKHKSTVSYTVDLNSYSIPLSASISDRDSSTSVAYNVQAGAAYSFTDNIALDLGLRYADLGEAELGSFLEADSMISKEAILALRYTF